MLGIDHTQKLVNLLLLTTGEAKLHSTVLLRRTWLHSSMLFETYLNSENALPQEDVPAGGVDVVIDGISRVDHQPVNKLHRLGPLTSQLTAHNNLISRQFKI